MNIKKSFLAILLLGYTGFVASTEEMPPDEIKSAIDDATRNTKYSNQCVVNPEKDLLSKRGTTSIGSINGSDELIVSVDEEYFKEQYPQGKRAELVNLIKAEQFYAEKANSLRKGDANSAFVKHNKSKEMSVGRARRHLICQSLYAGVVFGSVAAIFFALPALRSLDPEAVIGTVALSGFGLVSGAISYYCGKKKSQECNNIQECSEKMTDLVVKAMKKSANAEQGAVLLAETRKKADYLLKYARTKKINAGYMQVLGCQIDSMKKYGFDAPQV